MKYATTRICAAVLAATGVGSSHAVTLAPDGYGQVLLYPYYTVQNGYDTLISVENAANRGKALKLRFLESLNGRPVLSLNVYLAPYDVWTAKIAADAGGGAKLVVTDLSCTAPAIATFLGGPGEMAFLSAGFDGSGGLPADALASIGTARTAEGYLEVIEMGDIDPDYQLPNAVGFLAAVQVDKSQPAGGEYPALNCAAVNNEWATAQPFPNAGYGGPVSTSVRGLQPGTGGLAGTGTLINVGRGTDYSYDPVALGGFYMAKPPMHTAPADAAPSLADAAPTSTVMVIDPVTGTPTLKADDWSNNAAGAQPGVDAVSAVLMRSALINEFVVNTAIYAGTDWIATLPTKRWYVDQVLHPVRPFSALFSGNGACEPTTVTPYNQSGTGQSGTIGFATPPAHYPDVLCWTTNVLTFNNSQVLFSVAPYSQAGHHALGNVNVGVWRAGRVSLSFPSSTSNASYHWANAQSAVNDLPADLPSHQLVNEASPNHVYQGLPMIGFAVQQYINGSLPGGILSNYGGSYLHRYQRNITP